MATNAEQNQLKQANDDNAPSTGAGGPSSASAGSSRVANYSSGSQPTSQGSGRFTNLKKYVNANQGAGEQLGSKITNTIDKNIEKTNKEATTQAGSIANNIQAEKDRLAEGTQFNQQLQNQEQDGASQIANDVQSKQRFSNLLNNQNVASNLQTNAQTAADQATAGFNNLNKQVNNLGTEQGRFALLQQSVKNPQYTQGQQRLDQLFLQAGNPNQLVQNQRNLQQNVNSYGNALTNQFSDLGSQIGQVGQQATDVSKLLGGTLNTQTQSLIDAQNAEAQGLNSFNSAANNALQTYFTNGYSAIQDPAQKAAIDKILQEQNLKTGMRTYNVLDNSGYNKYLTSGRSDLTGADVVDANELARYQSLAGLSGLDPSKNLFTSVGNAGPSAGIKGQELNADIAARRAALEKQLTDQSVGTNTTNYRGLLDYIEGKGGTPSIYNTNPDGTVGTLLSGSNNYENNLNRLLTDQSIDNTGNQHMNAGGVMGNSVGLRSNVQAFLDQLKNFGYKDGLGGDTETLTGTTGDDYFNPWKF